MKYNFSLPIIIFLIQLFVSKALSQTIAAWPFDEQKGIYPSCVISDVSDNDFPLVIGPGGMIVDGKFGNALEPIEQPKIIYPDSGSVKFGLYPPKNSKKSKSAPMTWKNANFCALMTSGENHLRKEVGFKNPTESKLNLGNFDWTVEFWFQKTKNTNSDGTVFEIGTGPRGENYNVTKLILNKDFKEFIFYNKPAGKELIIPSDQSVLISNSWHHYAFVYSSKENQIKHFVDGKLQSLPNKIKIESLQHGDEAYMSIGRNGLWQHPLQGKIDELRFSLGQVYNNNFSPPSSFSPLFNSKLKELPLKKGPPLLFSDLKKIKLPINLNSRKYLFIDNSIIEKSDNIKFNVNPPKDVIKVFDVKGSFRKHLSVVQDDTGLIRIYNAVDDDHLEVLTSKDGIHFINPKIKEYKSHQNIVMNEPVGTGMVFLDPNAPANQKWKYLSGFHDRGVFLYTSPDGYNFKREKIYVLPFRTGSQSNIFYDDQKQEYATFHRTDMGTTSGGVTERNFVMTTTKEINKPWPFKPITQKETAEIAKTRRLHDLNPWYLDNGPLTPGGFGVEYPWIFTPVDSLDPVGTDIYVPKVVKYKWAPDVYLAFPEMYFHYDGDGTETRQILGDSIMNRGSGQIEVQLSVSRNGIDWKRYPRPSYIGIGKYSDDDIHQVYIAEGMIRKGNEIWQYFFGDEAYHSTWSKKNLKRGVYLVKQRLDGFVSADSPYGKTATIKTKPLVFKGDRLVLNINTGAAGYAQVGILDENGNPIEGFSADDCIYINGNFINAEVEWINKGKDISFLQGKTIQLEFKMRGSKLYSMQFVQHNK